MILFIRSPVFDRTVRVLVLNNPALRTQITRTLTNIKKNPFLPVLKTERVLTKRNKLRWSSLVKDDMRIIWDFTDTRQTKIQLLTVGGNKEPLKVYKKYVGKK